MYPLVSWFKKMSDVVTIPLFGFSLLRSYPGAIFAYIGFGISMSVFMDIDKIHFYDPETTKAID